MNDTSSAALSERLNESKAKAPFDPEAVASTGLNYQGIDYFMMPSLRSLGFNVKFQF